MKASSAPLLNVVFYLLLAVSVIAVISNLGMLSLFFRNGEWEKKEIIFTVAMTGHISLICVSLFQKKSTGVIVLILSLVLEMLILPFGT
jgi:hypothetical protein